MRNMRDTFNESFEIASKHRYIILTVLFFVLLSIWLFILYKESTRYYIFVKFIKSGPLHKGMPVCFRGYEIGKTKSITLSEDYKYILVKIVLDTNNPKIPKDVYASVKKYDMLGNYIDLVPKNETSTLILKKGEIVEGHQFFDVGTFLAELSDTGLLIPLLKNFSNAAVSLNKTSTNVGGFFVDSRLVLKDNRQNFKHTTESLNQITSNVNTSFSKDKLNNTASSVNTSAENIQSASENIKNITKSVDCATRGIDKTVEQIDSTISEAHATASNAKVITGGLCEVLSKRFAGLRIIFGKPLNKNKCQKNCRAE